MPADGQAVFTVYDVPGKVATLCDDDARAGRCYDVAFEAGRPATGLYVYELCHHGQRTARTLLLVQ